ncbi:MAG TPA: hypothetical protein PLS03_13235, partial [Terrimicrobiaceae bacterium]|nr:hypothetical protein [Terrimicrobiaceae bacterium]
MNPAVKSALISAVPALDSLSIDGSQFDVFASGDLRIMVNRTGAEMVSLARQTRDGQWRGFLYRDGQTAPPATGWANHATVMGYFLHRLWNEQSVYCGRVIRGGNHG